MTEDELDQILETYEVPEPPAGFADRVMAAAHPRPARRWSATSWGVLAAAAVLALALALVGLWPTRPVTGALHARRRTEVTLGARGVAVAENGARLRWTVDGTRAEIEQSEGDVFYRVSPGQPFVVRTPEGDVRVRGTCFRVEVLEMNVSPQLFAGAAAGALVAGAVVVSVYEGEVAVQNEHGEVSVEAGERSVIEPSRAPSEPSDAPASLARRPRDPQTEAARDETPATRGIDEMDAPALRARLRSVAARSRERAHEVERLRGLLDDAELADPGRSRFFPASPADLRRWADACQLRLDQPPVMGIEPGRVGEHAETLELDPAEARAVQDAIERAHSSLTEDLRALYVEATGDVDGAAALSPRAMLAEIRDKAGTAEQHRNVMHRIARERAGLERPPPADAELSPSERAVRRYARVGDEFQERLARALGPERARELRARDEGWPWARSIFAGCDDD
ncbi:MAG TPA: FecR domain-containing protein [Sandaracinaceae bacterium LLY-WYZ-13_1]|nr:FecR domain-containing protein [Sandaracinaceae bacterium LLY-WYZ-13_1]